MGQTVLAARQMAQGLSAETVSGTAYTLAAADGGKEKQCTNAAAKTITVPATSVLGTDFICSVANMGAGAAAIAPDTGVTLRNNLWKIERYKNAVIRAIGTDEYIVEADEPDGVAVLTDGANISTDCSLARAFRVTLGGNRTLDNPTNGIDGKPFTVEFVQDATGSRTLTLGSKFNFGSDVTSLTLTTAANKRDRITVIYNSSADKFDIVATSLGY